MPEWSPLGVPGAVANVVICGLLLAAGVYSEATGHTGPPGFVVGAAALELVFVGVLLFALRLRSKGGNSP